MWEKFKERGFDLAAIGVLFSNLITFLLVIFWGYAPIIVENCKWLLYLEATLDALFIIWGIERCVKDMKK